MGGLMSSFGFGSKPAASNPGKPAVNFWGGKTVKKPGYEEMRKTGIPYKYAVQIKKDPKFSNTSIRKLYGTDKVFRINNGKDKFSVRDAKGLLEESFIHVAKTRENPNIEAVTEYLVTMKGFLREDAKKFITTFGQAIYQPADTGPSREVIAQRIRAIKAMEGIGSNFGNNLALNRQKNSKQPLGTFQNETSTRLVKGGDKVVHFTSALSHDAIDSDAVRRAGGIKMVSGAKVSINETEEAAGVVREQNAASITGKKAPAKTDNPRKSIPLSNTA